MTISPSTITSDSVIFIRNLILNNCTDPLSTARPTNSKFVLTAYPARPAVYPIITVKPIEFETNTQWVGTEGQLVRVALQVRIWARNQKEKNEITDDVYDKLRTEALNSDGTSAEGLYNFSFKMIGDVDEEGQQTPKSRLLQVSYDVVAS